MIDVLNYAAAETLKDGTPITVRAIRAEDRQGVLDAFGKLDRDAVYTRFFSFKKALTDTELDRLTVVDPEHVVALVAVAPSKSHETLLGGGRYCSEQPLQVSHGAELAFITADGHHGRGVASSILKNLVLIAREQGLSKLEADVLAQNRAMLRVFERSGLQAHLERDSNVVHICLRLKD